MLYLQWRSSVVALGGPARPCATDPRCEHDCHRRRLMVLGAVLTGFLWEGGNSARSFSRPSWSSSAARPSAAWSSCRREKVLIDMAGGIVQMRQGHRLTTSGPTTSCSRSSTSCLFGTARGPDFPGVAPDRAGEQRHLRQVPRLRRQPPRHGVHLRRSLRAGRDRQARSTAGLLEADIKLVEEEHHGPLGVLSKTADALPGFGIVAAVLGIVITMQAIDGPPKEIGEKVGRRPGGHLPGHPHVLRIRGPAGGEVGIPRRRPRWPTSAPSPRRSKASSTTWRRRSSWTRRGGAWPASFAPPASNSKTCSSRSKLHNTVKFQGQVLSTN